MLTAWALASAAILLAPAAGAQSASDRETAHSFMDEGDRKRDQGDWKGALQSYEAADAIMHVPTTTLEVARALAASGRLIEAREVTVKLLRYPVKPNEPVPFTNARRAADTLQSELGERIPSLRIVVTHAEGPLQVTIDGDVIPPSTLGLARKVDPGPHTIVVRARATTTREEVVVAERETRTVNVDVAPRPASATSTSAASAEAPTRKGTSVLVPIGFVSAGVGLAFGAVTGAMSLSQTSDLKEVCPNDACPRDKESDLEQAKTLGTVSTVAFVVSGAGGIVGAVGLLLARSEARKAAVRLHIGPAGAAVSGSF